MQTYKIDNPPDFSRKSKDGKFIYVLMFNMQGVPPRPFYVGQTSGLTARFSNHEMVTWHHARFDAPVRIYVGGEVLAADADAAEQDLIALLMKAGYFLANTSITDRMAKRIGRSRGNLREMTREEVRAYLSTPLPSLRVLGDWQQRWVRADRKYVILGSQLTSAQVVEYVGSLDYPTMEVRNISVAIARLHDAEVGYSKIVLADELKGTPGYGKLHKNLKRLTGVWNFNRYVRPETQHQFRLTFKHLAKATAAAKEQAGA